MSESFDEKFLELLSQLNQVVGSSGEALEGNLFYAHEDPAFPNAKISPYFEGKRQNLLAATLGRGRVLEIGTNGGHSALHMLYHNPKLHYTGVDICKHLYTTKAIEFLKNKFPERVDFYAGDSVKILPDMIEKKLPAAFDIVHVDGLHTTYHAQQDILHATRLAVRFAWIILDDTDMPHLAQLYTQLVSEGKLLKKAPEGWVQYPYHSIGMLPN